MRQRHHSHVSHLLARNPMVSFSDQLATFWIFGT